MIKIESITMKEVRGLRDLTLHFGGESFVVSGPNGSGKSGVVDAIEFCLTGAISRLSGQGTAGITLQKHGPHVDRRDDPAAAEVTIELMLPSLDRTATITRNMKTPKVLKIVPDEPDIRAAIEEATSHPEVVLSRREIIKYVLAEAGTRSKEVQALLRLDRISQVRSALGTARNRAKTAVDRATQDTTNARDALKRHLEVEAASPENVLSSVNERRLVLNVPILEALTEHAQLDDGVTNAANASSFNKVSALRDIDAVKDWLRDEGTGERIEVLRLQEDIQAIEDDPGLLQLVRQGSFVEKGLEYVDSQFCPLCDTEWASVEALREHLEEKVKLTASAGEQRDRMKQDAVSLASSAGTVKSLLTPVISLARSESLKDAEGRLSSWSDSLSTLATELSSVESVLDQKVRLTQGWTGAYATVLEDLDALRGTVDSKPDQSATVNAQTFLTRAQDRFTEYRKARQVLGAARLGESASRVAYETYNEIAERSLTEMYESVEADFSAFYREINIDDETGFKAKLEQGSGKLDLSVDFYGLGMFPPGAYHSEGHQDGMGVCLYLALMKRLFGDSFSFAVLDDVVMSIDSGHRKQFCRLLTEQFPGTQFIITTHDRIWARQMRSEGLIGPKASVEFQGWSVQSGPIVEEVAEVWDRISEDLAKNDVPAAAARLRQHLEYVMRELADITAAPIPYRGDAGYDLGQLFSAVVSRQSSLLKKAAASANSWNLDSSMDDVKEMTEARNAALEKYGGEQWVVNKAVHYNEWATLSKSDFEPVVEAVKVLLAEFSCPNAACGSWLYPVPKSDPSVLRCDCGETNMNLRKK